MAEDEKETVRAMIKIYCKKHHEQPCRKCSELIDYAYKKIDLCTQDPKPACSGCKIHCYNKNMKKKIKQVMRYSGPRMIIYHPIMMIRHILRLLRS